MKFGIKPLAAAAGRCGIGVANDKLRTFEIVFVIDFGTKEVLKAHGIDQELNTFFVDGGVVLVDGFIKGEAILETRTTTPLNKHTQFEVGVALFEKQLFDLGSGGIGKYERRRGSLQIDGFGKRGHGWYSCNHKVQ